MKYYVINNKKEITYVDSNFNLVVHDVYRAGYIENLVVLKANSNLHKELKINSDSKVIIDKNILANSEEIELDYISFLYNTITRKSNCCDKDLIENTDICSGCKEHTGIEKINIKELLNSISNVYLDTFDVLENYYNMSMFMKNHNGPDNFETFIEHIIKFLDKYNFTVFHKHPYYNNMNNLELHNESWENYGKFAIVKNQEKYLKTKTKKPLHLYAWSEDIGYIIGNKGSVIKKSVSNFNLKNKLWEVPFVGIKPIKSRIANNDMKEIEKKYFILLSLILILFKNKSDDKINSILKYKLLTSLYRVKKMAEDVSICLDESENLKMKEILDKLKETFPNIDFEDLKEVYEIPNGDGTFKEIRYWSYAYLSIDKIYTKSENYTDLEKFINILKSNNVSIFRVQDHHHDTFEFYKVTYI